MTKRRVEIQGAAHRVLRADATLLHPEETVFEAMLSGWSAQQASRGLAARTIESRLKVVRRFLAFTNSYPWQWQPADLEEWTVGLRSARRTSSTLRGYQRVIAQFLGYLIDQRYGWAAECEQRFGTHPVQICHEGNTLAHASDYEGRPGNRPFTRTELQTFLDYADEQVARARRLGRKGWIAAYRDATLFKVAYAWGLRRQEVVKLEVADFRANAAAPELGSYGMLSVRWGKASRGGPPRRRNVCTIMPWSAEVVAAYVEEVLPLYGAGRKTALWPTERNSRVSLAYANIRFCEYRDAAGLPEDLGMHCLRHSYVTHLVEDGWDPLFVQQQVGHVWGSTTALYTGVSGDYKNRMLQRALGPAFQPQHGEAADTEAAR